MKPEQQFPLLPEGGDGQRPEAGVRPPGGAQAPTGCGSQPPAHAGFVPAASLKPAQGGKPDVSIDRLWLSLEQLNGTAPDHSGQELPWRNEDKLPDLNRRDFWKLMGASAGLAGLVGCTRQPTEYIVPYVNQPEQIVQGKPLMFATAMPFNGSSAGLLVRSYEGRPVKIEGNPKHPTRGGTDPFAQASILGLYDPERSQTVTRYARIGDWESFLGVLLPLMDEHLAKKGEGFRILTGTVISPTLGGLLQNLMQSMPAARWHQWEPAGRDNARNGALMAFGQPLNTIYRFDQANVVFALDSDFLACAPGTERYARDFASRRGLRGGNAPNRLYTVESHPSNTGASSDHRLQIRDSDIEAFLRGLAQAVGAPGGAQAPSQYGKWIGVLARDLQNSRGASVVTVGDWQPAHLHALAHGINNALGNAGKTIVYTDSVEVNPVDQLQSIRELAGEMNAGKVETLVILGGNPVFDAPADLGFANALGRVKNRIRLGLYDDETSAYCHWHINEAHYLESWGDTRTFDGTASVIQPLIAPLYDGKSVWDMASAMLKHPDVTGYDAVRNYWRGQVKVPNFEAWWRAAVHDGVIPDTAFQPRQVALKGDFAAQVAPRPATAGSGLDLTLRPDPTIWDGRFANNGWLQELPKYTSQLTWDNVVYLSPGTAKKLGVDQEDVVEVRHNGRSVQGPVWVQPAQADDVVTLHFGYGRRRGGKVGQTGFDVYPLRTSETLWAGRGVEIRKTGRRYELACTQFHWSMDDRYPVRFGTMGEYRKDPDFVSKEPFEAAPPHELSLYPDWDYKGYAWGMTIDLTACVGCNACVVACNSENNIPIVGKAEVRKYREMHWLRVNRYFHGSPENPDIYLQPLMCVQCENAPCEVVCPVNATVHTDEGLNAMVYNRCVGTRYCSNNCPYKVRRFNFFLYTDWYSPTLQLMRNPEVTPRTRGVMEKCTYCVQRIVNARTTAEKENRYIRDGEIQTACQAACPTEAIVFGDINNKTSRVSKLREQHIAYGLLAELNTRPRTRHLARLRNPNPEMDNA